MSNTYNPNHKTEKTFARVGVKAIIYNSEKKILLLKRSEKTPRTAGKWSLPGGSLEQFENPKDGIIREITEETKLSIKNLRPVETMGHEYNGDSIVIIGYTCTTNDTPVLNWEHDEYKWATKEETLDMDISPITQFFLEKLRL